MHGVLEFCSSAASVAVRDSQGNGGSKSASAPASGLGGISLRNVVTSHLSGIQDASTADVGTKSAVKSTDALVAVHVAH